MKHFVNESSDMGFSLEVSRWAACMMSIRDPPKRKVCHGPTLASLTVDC